MEKNHRHQVIAALLNGGIVGAIVAGESEVKEEVKLAAVHNDDSSTLDEGQNVEVISPLLAERVEEVKEEFGSESLSLTRAERKEIGKPLVRFKKREIVEDEDDADFRQFKKEMGWE